MRIQHNIAAMNSYRQLGGNNNAVAKNLEKLSSGYKINRAGDDAAGLAISEKMRAQITGLETAQKNAEDGISLVQTGEGALTEVHSMLNRMAELATQASNGTYDDKIDRENLQAEVDALRNEINRISESTNFNGINLLDGSLGGPKNTNSLGDVLLGSGLLADGTSIPATDASGNKFEISDIKTSVTGLTATGDGFVNITYQDEDGQEKTKAVKFSVVSADSVTSMQNLADAINADKELKGIFKAEVTADGKFVIEGKQVGSKAKSKVLGITGLVDPAKVTVAKTPGVSVKFDGDINNGETIEIDGKTFTYKDTGADSSKGEFSDEAGLKVLLDKEFGAKYNVIGTITAGSGKGTAAGFGITDKNGFDVAFTTDSSTLTESDSGTKAKFEIPAFSMPRGMERELTFTYKDLGGATQTIKIKVTAGDNDEETAKNILAELQKNRTFNKTFENFDINVGADGKITFEAKNTGAIKAEVTSLAVTSAAANASKLAITASSIKERDALDTHLDLTNRTFVDGDTLTFGQNTYTFVTGADGSDGKTFGDIDALIAAAEQNGVILENVATEDGEIRLTAKSAAKFTFDFDGRVGADMIGGSITFGGTKFQFVEAGSNPKTEEGVKNIEVSKDATAEEIAKALADAMNGIKTKVDAEDETSDDVTWAGTTKANKAGKNTIVELTPDVLGKIDMPKIKFAGFGINLQVGDTNEDYQKVKVSVDSMDATSLGIDEVDITNQTKAGDSIKMIKDAINMVSAQRGKLGAVQNRLEHTINNLGVTTENITAAESRIRDTDMASEMMAYTKNNILVQSAQAMLAQANTLPQGVLQLLQ